MDYSSSYQLRNRAWNALDGKLGQAALVTLIFVIISSAASSATFGALTILLLPMEYAFTVAFLRMIRGEKELEVADLFTVYRDQFERTFIVELLMNLYTLLWMLLLIVPGIVKAYSYALAPYLVQDHPEMSASQAIDESMRLMEGHKMRLFMLDLSFIGWWLLCCLTFGLLTFIVAPYQLTARAEFYRELMGETVADETL
ncbi:MAG: DUF975 family protein [Paludibacteraceae bacterium]|nr:DUF975 family protein [Paludibacteraceae bacterium]